MLEVRLSGLSFLRRAWLCETYFCSGLPAEDALAEFGVNQELKVRIADCFQVYQRSQKTKMIFSSCGPLPVN